MPTKRYPIHPDDIQKKTISDYVMDVINRLIRKKWDGSEARFTYEDIWYEIKKDGEEKYVKPEDIHSENIVYVYLNSGCGWYPTFKEPDILHPKGEFIFRTHY